MEKLSEQINDFITGGGELQSVAADGDNLVFTFGQASNPPIAPLLGTLTVTATGVTVNEN